MDENAQKLKELIEASERILITSHIGPDGDAVSSSLLLHKTLSLNYPEKKIHLSLEEKPYGLDFLPGASELEPQPLINVLEDLSPDLLIILDANNVGRVSRTPEKVREYTQRHKPKLIIIDHHEPENIEANELFINNSSPAVTLDIYEIFLQKLNYRRPEGYAEITATGIYTDTGGFINRNLNFRKTFEVVPQLIADGADFEKIAGELKRISDKGFEVLKDLVDNTDFGGKFTFSFISDSLASDSSYVEAIRQATDVFRSELLRNIDGRNWGFIIYRDALAATPTYSVSFRAISGTKDVSKLAAQLGGGGHKPAAGAKFKSESIEQAIEKVKHTISITP